MTSIFGKPFFFASSVTNVSKSCKLSTWAGICLISIDNHFGATLLDGILGRSYGVECGDTILNSGVDPEELNVFSLNEQGMNFPEDGIYTLEKTLHKDPSLAKAFVTASLEGWRYAFAHSDEALDIVIRHMREAQVPATNGAPQSDDVTMLAIKYRGVVAKYRIPTRRHMNKAVR